MTVVEPSACVEVATLSSDAVRASMRVTGVIDPRTAPLLASVLRTHVTGGRRYLRVDLAAAQVTDPAVIAALLEARTAIAALGGTLVFENAGPRVVDAIRRTTLHTRSAQLTAAS